MGSPRKRRSNEAATVREPLERRDVFRPIVGARAHEEVIDQITFAIRSGAFRVGEKLPSVEDLALALKVSKPTIGEALRVLAQEGLVRTRRGVHGGVTVHSDSVPRTLLRIAGGSRDPGLRELLEARRAVEMEIARLAASRASEEDFERMRESIDRFASYAAGRGERDDAAQRLHFDYLFHYAMGYAAHSDLLAYYQHQILQQLVDALRDYLLQEEDPQIVIDLHEQTLRALRGRKPRIVDQAMDEHLRLVEEVVAARLEGEATPSPRRRRPRRPGRVQ